MRARSFKLWLLGCLLLVPLLMFAVISRKYVTEGNRLRHSKFVKLREDQDARDVVKEQAREA